MATVADLVTTPMSGLNHIDALLDKGPDWNYLTSNGSANVLYYSFSVASGNESGRTGQSAFSQAQQAGARTAFAYLQQVTGIEFRETADGNAAQFHLANVDIAGAYTTGMCSWSANNTYNPRTNELMSYKANAWIYLDNAEFGAANANLTPGTSGYETLLHELGHALGLKHPFLEETGDEIVLPNPEDHTGNTLMSYTHSGSPHSTYSPYDIAALNWLYGGDGLRGALGINSSTGGRFLTGTDKADTLLGTAFDDLFQAMGGNDMINGGLGHDTVIFAGLRSSYALRVVGDGLVAVGGATGTTTLQSIETVQFDDGRFALASLLDLGAPAAPQLAVAQNANKYALGNRPTMNGSAEANATVRVYVGEQLVAITVADANGLWSTRSNLTLADKLGYTAYATATDADGNTSPASALSVFHVDATAPLAPSLNVALNAGSNQPLFSGVGEAGTTIHLYRVSDQVKLGETQVGFDGKWAYTPTALPNGAYQVAIAASDLADNARAGLSQASFTVANSLNQVGSAGADTILMAAGSAAIDGGAGLDTVVYGGKRADFLLQREVYGFAVRDKVGDTDNLINIERIKFDDAMVALDIDGTAGQVYRLYRAAFDRVPDSDGLAFWIGVMDRGNVTLTQITADVMTSKEYTDLYAGTSDSSFIQKLYQHVLHREPDGAGFDWWVNNLNNVSRTDVLALFSESAENQAQVIGEIQHGIVYPFGW